MVVRGGQVRLVFAVHSKGNNVRKSAVERQEAALPKTLTSNEIISSTK
jgi:hypothetical protein